MKMNEKNTSETRRWRQVGIVVSAASCVVISICYVIQPDWLAPVTLVPTWCWLIPGIALAMCGYRRSHKLSFIAVLALWGLFTAYFVEEAHSIWRIRSWPTADWRAARERGRALRVVSLNCGAGQSRSVKEVASWKPDIVLLQESPGREQLEKLSQALFGTDASFLYGGDVSILTDGQMRPKFVNRAAHFVHAEVELPTGLRTDVMSVRLAPPVFRLDFWMPGFWIDHREKRIEHRGQIFDIVEHIQAVPMSSRLIVGGDFNSPPYDDVLAPLRHRLADAFHKAGRGWGATGTNDFPLFRVDQIWASQVWRSESVTAQKTRYSDHRMVVCDLTIAD